MTEARLPGGLPARPEGLALWREILDRPGEDLPRRIFADWMADNGDPARAEFVHAQLDRAALPAGDPRAEELLAVEEEALAAHGPSWEADFPASLRRGVEYRRGFAEVFTADADAFVRHAAGLSRRTPLRGLRLRDFMAVSEEAGAGDRLQRLIASPQLERLTLLDLKGARIGHQVIERILNAPQLANVKELELGSNVLGPADLSLVFRAWPGTPKLTALRLTAPGLGYAPLIRFWDPQRPPALRELEVRDDTDLDRRAMAVAGIPILETLRSLILTGNRITGSGVRDLLRGQPWQELEYLDLSGSYCGAEGVRALAMSSVLARLRVLVLHGSDLGDEAAQALASGRAKALAILRLGNNRIGPVGMRALAAAPFLPRLTVLSLEGNPLRRRGMRSLARIPSCPHLRVLSLGRCRIRPKGLLSLINSPLLPGLVQLNLRSNCIDDDAITTLARSVRFVRLATLDLINNDLGPAGAEALAGWPHLARLLHLHLGRNTVLARGAAALADSPCLSRLVTLGLSSNDIGDEGARALAASPHLANLISLDLVNNGIGDEGARALAASPYLGRLTALNLEGNRLGDAGTDALKARFRGAVKV